jgi:hypothetical protein
MASQKKRERRKQIFEKPLREETGVIIFMASEHCDKIQKAAPVRL